MQTVSFKLKAESPFIRNGRYVCVSVYICVYVKKIPPTILSLCDSIYACTYIQVRMRMHTDHVRMHLSLNLLGFPNIILKFCYL